MKLLALASLFAFLPACGGTNPAPVAPATPTAPTGNPLAPFVLAADPGEAIGVVDAKVGGAAERIVVQGRIAKIVKGYAVFTLTDLGLPYCGETNPEDHCKTPWDYCCEQPATITANSLVVEVHGADGKPLAAATLGDLRLLDAVKVQGKLVKDENGNFVVTATGVFRSQRPQLPAGLNWPQ